MLSDDIDLVLARGVCADTRLNAVGVCCPGRMGESGITSSTYVDMQTRVVENH